MRTFLASRGEQTFLRPQRSVRCRAWRAFFEPGGRLEQVLPGYEARPEQAALAAAVELALASGQHLLAEAGTGTGKSLAYLIPALESGQRVVVATATKALQEQLLGKDVPTAAAALGREVQVAVLKGRQNYLCRMPLQGFELLGGQLFPRAEDAAAFDAHAAAGSTRPRRATAPSSSSSRRTRSGRSSPSAPTAASAAAARSRRLVLLGGGARARRPTPSS